MHVVYDIETLSNCFTYTDVNIENNDKNVFVIHESRDDRDKLYEYLLKVKTQIGYNNLRFDYPVIHYFMYNYKRWKVKTAEQVAQELSSKANSVINDEFPEISEKIRKIRQIDLYRIWHFDNKNKRTSLKDLQIHMQWYNVQTMPIDHTDRITEDQIPSILEYNLNDVLSTLEFYKRTIPKLELRKELGKLYGLNLTNSNDSKMGVQIFSALYEEITGLDYDQYKDKRTYRKTIKFEDCILPIVDFKLKSFKKMLDKMKKTVIGDLKEDSKFSETVIVDEIMYEYGKGGIHAFGYPGVHKATDDVEIHSVDVASLYPSVGVQYKFYPKHLGTSFTLAYETIVRERLKAKKAGLKARAEGLKLSANSIYGKSNEAFSFFYDPQYTLSITLNGQLLLTMLCEKLIMNDFKIIMVNTDGLECYVPKEKRELFFSLCKQWEEETKLVLEYEQYKILATRDVNNYVAQYINDKIKYKGDFEIDKDYHKDPSLRVVSKALRDYFIHGMKPEDSIINGGHSIFDFCARIKSSKGMNIEYHQLNLETAEKIVNKMQKVSRVYITKTKDWKKFGYVFKTEQNKSTAVYSKQKVALFNKVNDNEKEINYDFYIQETKKIISVVEDTQLDLFS